MLEPMPRDFIIKSGLSSPYRRISLRQLIGHIAIDRDRLALEEFHNHRQAFHLDGGPPLLFAQFLAALADTVWARNLAAGRNDILEQARDLTVDKFTLVPATKPGPSRTGIDCRHYFQGLLQQVDGEAYRCPPLSPLEDEAAIAAALQRYVMRHFHLSLREARRSSNPARTRYAWRVNGSVLYLWMPASLPGNKRRAWLEDHVNDPDSLRRGERARVQQIIDAHWGIARHVPIDSRTRTARQQPAAWSGPPAGLEEAITVRGLAAVVAHEKSDNIDLLRPAIRALGSLKLHALVCRIFEMLSEGTYQEKALAQEFGLSRPTFTRFAGSQWRNSGTRVPDLWRNVAHTLAKHSSFTEAARRAGVWERVVRALGK